MLTFADITDIAVALRESNVLAVGADMRPVCHVLMTVLNEQEHNKVSRRMHQLEEQLEDYLKHN